MQGTQRNLSGLFRGLYDMADAVAKDIAAMDVAAEYLHQTPLQILYGSWGLLEESQYRAFADAGGDQVTLNVNDAGDGGRPQSFRYIRSTERDPDKGLPYLIDKALAILRAGLRLGLMPFITSFEEEWMATCGRWTAALVAEIQRQAGLEVLPLPHGCLHDLHFDAEGQAVASIRAIALRDGISQMEAIDRGMRAFWTGATRARPCVVLRGMGLYPSVPWTLSCTRHRRDATDALSVWSAELDGHQVGFERVTPQAYPLNNVEEVAIWGRPDFSPGGHQERVLDDWAPMLHHFREMGLAVGAWALERLEPVWPERMTAQEGMRRTLDVLIRRQVPCVAWWAEHLMDEPHKPVEAARWELFLSAVRTLSGREDLSAFTSSGEAPKAYEDTDEGGGYILHWGRAWESPELWKGGMPEGFALPKHHHPPVKTVGLSIPATAVRKRWDAERHSPGTAWVVPFTRAGYPRSGVVVIQNHPYTFVKRDGKWVRVPHHKRGATVGLSLDRA